MKNVSNQTVLVVRNCMYEQMYELYVYCMNKKIRHSSKYPIPKKKKIHIISVITYISLKHMKPITLIQKQLTFKYIFF